MPSKFDWVGTRGDISGTWGDLVVVQHITLSLPTPVEVELGCDRISLGQF